MARALRTPCAATRVTFAYASATRTGGPRGRRPRGCAEQLEPDPHAFQSKERIDLIELLAVAGENLRQTAGRHYERLLLPGPFRLYAPDQAVDRLRRAVHDAGLNALLGARADELRGRDDGGRGQLGGLAE